MAKECQYLFCDCMYIKGTNKHMGINDIKELTKKYPNCKFIVSHLDDETRNRLNEEKIKNVIIPNDGDIINIEQYKQENKISTNRKIKMVQMGK